MTAWAYLVVSTDAQAESLEDQERWANETAVAHGWQIARTFSGVSSGAKGTRELLTSLLAELRAIPKAQRPKRILMIRLDRAGRGIGIDSLAAIAEIRALGAMIHTREDGDLKIERAADTLVPFMRILSGALENEARSDKWKAVHARRRAAGLHVGTVPFGCVLADGRAVPYEPEAAVVRELFERAEDGWGYTRLARWARERAPRKRLNDGTERPYSWAPSTVKSILKSSTIRGLLVTEEQWQRMKAARSIDFRARAPKRWLWPLLGAVRCTCGKRLTGHASGVPGYRIRYYICRFHSLEPGETSHPAHRADALERAFAAFLERLAGNPDVYLAAAGSEGLKALDRREHEAKNRLEELDRRRQRTWQLAEEGALSGAQLRERLDEIDADRRRAQGELVGVRESADAARRAEASSETLATALADLAPLWPQADVEHRQEIARAVAALPAVGGFWTLPDRRHELFAGADAAKLHIADVICRNVPRGTLRATMRLTQLVGQVAPYNDTRGHGRTAMTPKKSTSRRAT